MAVIAERTEHVARPRARPRRLRRPEPVDRAGRPGRDRASRASASSEPPTWPGARRGDRARPRRRRARALGSRPRARRSSSPTSTPPSARSPTRSAPAGPRRTRRCARTSTSSRPCALGGVLDAASVPLLRCRVDRRRREQPARRRRRRRGPARRARDPVDAGLRRQRGRHHQHRRRARARAATTAGAPSARPARSATPSRAVLDMAEADGITPLAAAQELARRRLERRRDRRRPPDGSDALDAGTPASRRSRPRPRRAAGPRRAACSGAPRSVSRAGTRSPAGTSSQAASSSSSACARPSASARRAAARARAGGRCTRRASRRVVDDRPVAGADQRQAARAQPPQAVEVGGQRAAARGDEDAPLAEHRVAGERDAARHEHEVVGGVAGHVQRRQAARTVPVADAPAAPRPARRRAARAARRAPRRGRGGRASARPRPRRPLRDRRGDGATCCSSAGPGSTTQQGSRPTTHVFVPLERQRRRVAPPRTSRTSIALNAARSGTPARRAT